MYTAEVILKQEKFGEKYSGTFELNNRKVKFIVTFDQNLGEILEQGEEELTLAEVEQMAFYERHFIYQILVDDQPVVVSNDFLHRLIHASGFAISGWYKSGREKTGVLGYYKVNNAFKEIKPNQKELISIISFNEMTPELKSYNNIVIDK